MPVMSLDPLLIFLFVRWGNILKDPILALGMILSFLSLSCLMLSGATLLRFVAHQSNLRVDASLAMGVGFFVAASLTALWLRTDLLPLNVAAISAAGACLLLALTGSTPLLKRLSSKRAQRPAAESDLTRQTESVGERVLRILISIVIVGFFFLILLNNVYREIFPWDAFTTWMYRAKIWVLSNGVETFSSTTRWLDSGSTEFVLEAAHYPIAVSAIAAFASVLSGGWSDQAASLPWFFAAVSNSLVLLGLCRCQAPNSRWAPLIACGMLSTTPLLHLQGSLAGYADIWIMGTSGMGLAGLCVWSQRQNSALLAVSFLLLGLGCLWKLEGWVWLALGLTAFFAYMAAQRFGTQFWLGIPLALVAIWAMQPIDLGGWGIWGVTDNAFRFGSLGSVALLPQNPLWNYVDMTFWRANFLLLMPLYLVVLFLLAICRRPGSGLYLMMAFGIASIHFVIFGLSTYSHFAQIGTTANRFLLQTLPVFIVTISAASQLMWRQQVLTRTANRPLRGPLTYGLTLVGLALVGTLPLVILAIESGGSETDHALRYDAAELSPVIGEWVKREQGFQFTGNNLPVGVARAPLTSPRINLPRYLITDSWMASPGTVSFYWINAETTRVHSVPLAVSGASIIDMADYADFWQKPVIELGYLVQPEHFNRTGIHSLTLSPTLFDATEAIFKHWLTPEPLSHRLINIASGHAEAPVMLQRWLTSAFFCVCLLALGWATYSPLRKDTLLTSVGAAAGMLWLLGAMTHLNQALSITTPLLLGAPEMTSDSPLAAPHIATLAEQLRQSPNLVDQPILAVGTGAAGELHAARLPFMVLPRRAIAMSEALLMTTVNEWRGDLVVLGDDEESRKQLIGRLQQVSRLKPIDGGKGFVVLSAEGL